MIYPANGNVFLAKSFHLNSPENSTTCERDNGRVGLAHGMLIKAPSTSCEQVIKGHSTQTLYTFDPVTDEEEEK